MARPSRNIDEALLAAGRELLPLTGCAGLSARRLTEHAGVNLAMLNYHFGSRDNFVRSLLARLYEDMFAQLTIEAGANATPIENLRAALGVLARFAHTHRRALARIAADALAGELIATEFFLTNIPRHGAVLARLIRAAQRAGQIEKLPLQQTIAFIAGSGLLPVLIGGALTAAGQLPAAFSNAIERQVLPLRAIEQRIDLALRGLTPDRRLA